MTDVNQVMTDVNQVTLIDVKIFLVHILPTLGTLGYQKGAKMAIFTRKFCTFPINPKKK